MGGCFRNRFCDFLYSRHWVGAAVPVIVFRGFSVQFHRRFFMYGVRRQTRALICNKVHLFIGFANEAFWFCQSYFPCGAETV